MRPAVLIALAAACGTTPPTTQTESTESLVQKIVAARQRMHSRYTAVAAMQRAIGIGDLDRARAEAISLEAASEPEFLPEWQPYVEAIRRDAAQVAESTDTMTAAKTMAQLGRSCARCHEATQAKITFPRERIPSANEMASHQWASARMWEGIIASADDRWRVGARMLAGARLTPIAESGELGIADDVARAKLLASRAIHVGDRDQRANLYGELLATCAHCHATIRDRVLHPQAARLEP